MSSGSIGSATADTDRKASKDNIRYNMTSPCSMGLAGPLAAIRERRSVDLDHVYAR
jgi:hypothetical protein